jgi:hypothetical protein
VQVLVRPEQVVVRRDESAAGCIVRVEPAGSTSEIEVRVDGASVLARVLGPPTCAPGDLVRVTVERACVAFPTDGA